jgi:hypothetical protein
MTMGAWMLLISICLVVVLALVVWGLLEQVKSWRAEALKVRAERDQFKADLAAAHALAGATHKIEETRNAQKDAVASGGFAGSLGVLHDVAARSKPKT